ncbi:MAG: chemotaxis protein CheA [Gammaproteobacteria bacterium]|nr:chemotaxis protein CheA [Gammaproteobacteria bacterium]NBY23792.1 chemotaxis protein CheA [Gammaproteobacteria bacterium]
MELLNLDSSNQDRFCSQLEGVLGKLSFLKEGAEKQSLPKIASLVAPMERILQALTLSQLPLEGDHLDQLLASADCLSVLVADPLSYERTAIEAPLVGLQSILNQIVSPEVTLIEEFPEATYTFTLSLNLKAISTSHLELIDVVIKIESLGSIQSGSVITPRVDLMQAGPMEPMIWEVTIVSKVPQDEFCRSLSLAPFLTGEDASWVPATPDPLPSKKRVVETTDPAASARIPPARAGGIRISVTLVDQLMSLAGELVLLRNQVRRSVDAHQVLSLQTLLHLDGLTRGFYDVVLNTRLQPIGNIFNKFPRLVRDLARQLDKKIELVIEGAEVSLDKTILDGLSDPLTHLIRNACDHGLETFSDRSLSGKPETGLIKLTARHLGDEIHIILEDDGRGIDPEFIKRKVLQKELLTEADLHRMDDEEILRLILLPGFSTAHAVTDLSGRGVGMDVVNSNLESMGGSLEITSVVGSGTQFYLRLPLTLAIIQTLLIKAGDQVYAITKRDIEELVHLHPDRSDAIIDRGPHGEMVRLRDQLMPLIRLTPTLQRALTGIEGSSMMESGATSEQEILAVVKVGLRRYGLIIDSIVASEEVVVKPLHAALRNIRIYSGATVLGDGQVALILSADGLARFAEVSLSAGTSSLLESKTNSFVATLSGLLIERLSKERFVIPLESIERIVHSTVDRVQPQDGRYYLTIDQKPVLIANERELHSTIDALDPKQPLFAIILKGETPKRAFLVTYVIGVEQIEEDQFHLLDGMEGPQGAVVMEEKIVPIHDLLDFPPFDGVPSKISHKVASRSAGRDVG